MSLIRLQNIQRLYKMGEETIHALRGILLKIRRNARQGAYDIQA